MLFSSETRRLKSAIHAQDAQLGQSIADLAATIGLGTAGAKVVSVARAHPVALAGATIAGAGLAYLMLRPRNEDAASLKAAALDAADGMAQDWMDAARSAKDAARDQLLDLYERGVATAEARAAVAAEQAEAVADAMRRGLAILAKRPPKPRSRCGARPRDTMERGGRLASRGLHEGRRMAQEHPVAASVAGVAAGAGLVALLLRGRGVMKLLTPLALAAAIAGVASRLRGGTSAEDMIDDVEDAAEDAVRSAGRTARRATAKAQAAGTKATRAAAETAAKASRKVKSAAKAAPAKAARTARDAAEAVSKPVAEAAAKVEAEMNNVAKH
ncbi:hypothetical protein MASR1M32_34280 [Rhodobacter sp.]